MNHEADVDDLTRAALAEALGEKKVKWNDRRLILLYVLVIGLAVWLGMQQQQSDEDRRRFERAAVLVCKDTKANAKALNKLIRKLEAVTATSPMLSPREQRLRADYISDAKQKVPTCPPRR